MSDPYVNKSKKLLEDVGKFFKRLGGDPDMSMFDSPLEQAVIFAKRTSGATIGAKQKHSFRIHSVRREGASEFTDQMAVGHLLLSKKIELAREVTGELVPLEIEGFFSNTGKSVVIRSLTAIDADEAGLREKLDQLHEDKEFESKSFGTLTYQLRYHSYGGRFDHEDRPVDVEFKSTGPDEIEAQCAKLEKFFAPTDDVAAELRDLVREHRSFKEKASKDAAPELSRIWVDGNRVTVNFSAPGIGIAYATSFYRDGEFQRREMDKITGPNESVV